MRAVAHTQSLFVSVLRVTLMVARVRSFDTLKAAHASAAPIPLVDSWVLAQRALGLSNCTRDNATASAAAAAKASAKTTSTAKQHWAYHWSFIANFVGPVLTARRVAAECAVLGCRLCSAPRWRAIPRATVVATLASSAFGAAHLRGA